MGDLSSILEEISYFISWAPYVLVGVLILSGILFFFLRKENNKTFILLSAILNILWLIFAAGIALQSLMISSITLTESYTFAGIVFLPIIFSLIFITIYLSFKKIFSFKNLFKYSILSFICIIIMVISAFLSSMGFGFVCGQDEACGYAAIGGFVIGPIFGLIFNGLIIALFYKKFLRNDYLPGSGNLTLIQLLKSKQFLICILIIILIMVSFISFKGYQLKTDSTVSAWKTYQGKGYILKYPPKGQVNVGEPGDGGDPYSDDGDIEAIILTRGDEYDNDNDFYYGHNIYVTKFMNIQNLDLEEWWNKNKEITLVYRDIPEIEKIDTVNGYPIIYVENEDSYYRIIQKDNFILRFETGKNTSMSTDGSGTKSQDKYNEIAKDYLDKIVLSFN